MTILFTIFHYFQSKKKREREIIKSKTLICHYLNNLVHEKVQWWTQAKDVEAKTRKEIDILTYRLGQSGQITGFYECVR